MIKKMQTKNTYIFQGIVQIHREIILKLRHCDINAFFHHAAGNARPRIVVKLCHFGLDCFQSRLFLWQNYYKCDMRIPIRYFNGSRIQIIQFSVVERTDDVHEINRSCSRSADMKCTFACFGFIEWVQSINFEINCIHQNDTRLSIAGVMKLWILLLVFFSTN